MHGAHEELSLTEQIHLWCISMCVWESACKSLTLRPINVGWPENKNQQDQPRTRISSVIYNCTLKLYTHLIEIYLNLIHAGTFSSSGVSVGFFCLPFVNPKNYIKNYCKTSSWWGIQGNSSSFKKSCSWHYRPGKNHRPRQSIPLYMKPAETLRS